MKSYDFGGMTPDQYLNEGCTQLEFACIQNCTEIGDNLKHQEKNLADLKLHHIFVISKEEKNSKEQKLFNIY